jgi:hypothetical protein
MASGYSVYSYTYNFDSKTKKKIESKKAYAVNSKGNEAFYVEKKENDKILKKIQGKKAKTSKKFTVDKDKKQTKEKVYKMLKKEFGMEYDMPIKEFLRSSEYKKLQAGG